MRKFKDDKGYFKLFDVRDLFDVKDSLDAITK